MITYLYAQTPHTHCLLQTPFGFATSTANAFADQGPDSRGKRVLDRGNWFGGGGVHNHRFGGGGRIRRFGGDGWNHRRKGCLRQLVQSRLIVRAYFVEHFLPYLGAGCGNVGNHGSRRISVNKLYRLAE